MTVAGMPRGSLRPEQAELTRLAWAFSLSLAFHLAVYGGYYTGNRFQLWQRLHWPAWLQPPKAVAQLFKKKENPPPLARAEIPLMFVNVSPAQASPEPPKDARYYSDKNARAANPEAGKDTGTPKIDGTQKEVPKTEDVPRDKFVPLQPARSAQPAEVARPELKPRPAYTPGDLTMAKPSPTPRATEGDAQEARPERPRTIRQALAQLRDSQAPGLKMRQDGGVSRRHEVASLDTKATPFGAYDAALVEAISQRWFTLLDEREYASDSRGKVVLRFRLHHDGRVTDINVAESTVGEVLSLLCQKAVLDPAPFGAWPSDMRRTLGEMRSIQFTFYYN